MTQRVLFQLFFFLAAVFSWSHGEAAPAQLKTADIHRVMERFFGFHIEVKELSAPVVRRFIKIYIEQFDPDKSYLLEEEVLPYFNLTEKSASQILGRLEAKDYSDFVELNEIFQRSIERFQSNRRKLAESMSQQGGESFVFSGEAHAGFSGNSDELLRRQKNHMVRFFLYHKMRTRLDTPDRKLKVFTLFDKKLRRVENNYLYKDSSGAPMPGERAEHLFSLRMLKAFAKSLDTHTSFFSPEEAQEMRLSLEKQFEGVGIILSEGVDGIVIAELIEGSPAHQSGDISVNDLLVEIDGHSVEPLQFNEVLDLLKKKDKGSISLGFKRVDRESGSEKFFRVALVKRPITMRDERIQTGYERYGNGVIGKIALHSFYESSNGESSEKDIKEAIRSFQEKGELVGLVLDLRENSGGFLSQAVKVAGLFLNNGVVVISKYGRGEIHYLRNIVTRSFYNGPLIVLTSKMSASASEIVAQTLQDYGVALVVGDQRTFGKGSIQYQTLTDDRADIFFKVTVGRYYTVSGRSTQIEGVIADIVVPSKYAPYKIGERYLEYPLPPDHATAAYVDPLTDLDEKTRQIFEKRYLPHLQRVVEYWKKMLPQLKKNSMARLSQNQTYQNILKKQEVLRSRVPSLPVNTIDDQVEFALDDIQMSEAFEILKDMILLESVQHPQAALLPTG